MTKNDTDDVDDTNGTLDQPCDSKQHYDNGTILGHKMTLHGLDDWHQVCFQWCQQQGQAKVCSMYCFKHKNTNSRTHEPLSPTEQSSSTDTTASSDTTTTDYITNFGQTIKSYMTDTLKNYSIVVVKGTDSTTGGYIKAHQNDQPIRDPRIHEINIGVKAETAVNNAELMVKKTHDFSKGLMHTWQNNNNNNNKWMNGFDYSGTFRIMKDRAVKMMDVARGKYDNDEDNLKKKSPNQDSDDADTTTNTSETNMEQDTQDTQDDDDGDNGSKDGS